MANIRTYTNSSRALQSLQSGKRLPEAQFANLKVAAKGQRSVYGMFRKSSSMKGGDSSETLASSV